MAKITPAEVIREFAAALLSIEPTSILSIEVETVAFDSTSIFGTPTSSLDAEVVYVHPERGVITAVVSSVSPLTFSALQGRIASRAVTGTTLYF